MKLLVIGHGRHGKDTVCDILKNNYGYNFISSSEFCSKLFIYDQLKEKYNYSNYEECYADRHNHRAEWYDLISDYNKENPAKLGTEIFKEYDIYCGLRNAREFYALKEQKIYDYALWVDRSEILATEKFDSMTLNQTMADFTIDNNHNLIYLREQIDSVMNYISTI